MVAKEGGRFKKVVVKTGLTVTPKSTSNILYKNAAYNFHYLNFVIPCKLFK